MARIKQSLRSLYNSLTQFIDDIVGRAEEHEAETALPTQHNQYFT